MTSRTILRPLKPLLCRPHSFSSYVPQEAPLDNESSADRGFLALASLSDISTPQDVGRLWAYKLWRGRVKGRQRTWTLEKLVVGEGGARRQLSNKPWLLDGLCIRLQQSPPSSPPLTILQEGPTSPVGTTVRAAGLRIDNVFEGGEGNAQGQG